MSEEDVTRNHIRDARTFFRNKKTARVPTKIAPVLKEIMHVVKEIMRVMKKNMHVVRKIMRVMKKIMCVRKQITPGAKEIMCVMKEIIRVAREITHEISFTAPVLTLTTPSASLRLGNMRLAKLNLNRQTISFLATFNDLQKLITNFTRRANSLLDTRNETGVTLSHSMWRFRQVSPVGSISRLIF